MPRIEYAEASRSNDFSKDGLLKPSILILTSTFPRCKNDTEPPFVFELSRRLAAWFTIRVSTPHALGCRLRESFDGIFVHRFRYAPSHWQRIAYDGGILANLRKYPPLVLLVPFFLSAQLWSVVRLLRKYPVDIIHAHWIFPQGLIALLARRLTGCRAKILCTSHGGDFYGLKGTFFQKIKKAVAANCDHLTVVSHTMRGDFLKLGADPLKTSVIPMGVDLRSRFVPPEHLRRSKLLLFVGRLVEKKGLRYLLQAMPEILEQFPDFRLLVVGDGPERFELEKLSHDSRLNGNVVFLGAMRNDELPSFYQMAKIIVFPSVVGSDGDREGFGLVLVEAMGCECTAVVSDLPAMSDIVCNSTTAMVVPQRRPDAIASAVIKLLAEPERSSAMAIDARRYVLENFDWEIIVQKYHQLIGDLFSQTGMGYGKRVG